MFTSSTKIAMVYNDMTLPLLETCHLERDRDERFLHIRTKLMNMKTKSILRQSDTDPFERCDNRVGNSAVIQYIVMTERGSSLSSIDASIFNASDASGCPAIFDFVFFGLCTTGHDISMSHSGRSFHTGDRVSVDMDLVPDPAFQSSDGVSTRSN